MAAPRRHTLSSRAMDGYYARVLVSTRTGTPTHDEARQDFQRACLQRVRI
jgi:hypothetical protein